VDVPAEVRLRRLMDSRGMARDDAAARISRQADDDTRRGACDVIIDNSGPVEQTRDTVGQLIADRIRPFAANLAQHRRAPLPRLELIDPAARACARAGEAERLIGKRNYGNERQYLLEHIGTTAVPRLPAKDVVDLQLLVPDLAAAEELAPVLAELGYPGRRLADHLGEDGTEEKWFHANADPGRAVNLHVRVEDSVAARFARAFRDLLRTDDGQRQHYLELKRELIARTHRPAQGLDPDANHAATNTYAEAKEPYFLTMRRRLVPDSFA